ncbi:MAG: site-2 protease family protein [Candidatus Omnitrophica bacterium]|nr:site-2 protease family protein [Candidatus Omnitrophota bacterium]
MLETILVILLVVIPAIVLHEFAHGWAADRLGDPTARLMGRLTLNPVKHIDPVGTILVPGLLYLAFFFGISKSLFVFGWAKPVPVNFSRLRNPKRDIIWVGLAGPLMNIVLAFAFAQIAALGHFSALGEKMLVWSVILNVGLAVFNMLPVPPLDGSRVVTGLIPASWEKGYLALEPFGFILVIILLNTGMLDSLDPLIYGVASLMGLK